MNDEILERLMIDDSLQALPPDVSALLAAYLRTLPEGDTRLAAWRRVADLASQAMPADPPEALPPLPAELRPAGISWRIGRVGLSIAAVLAIGIAIGLHWPAHHANSPIGSDSSARVGQTQALASSQPPHETGVKDFWSSQRMVASALEQKHPAHSSWKANSPLNVSPVNILMP